VATLPPSNPDGVDGVDGPDENVEIDPNLEIDPSEDAPEQTASGRASKPRTLAPERDRPSDHFDTPAPSPADPSVIQPKLGLVGSLRFFWRQLTSMRTALFLLLLVAFAAIPGSLVPQQTSDPNGVIQYKAANPELSKVLDFLGVFNTYSSVWFSAIYLLLFISLVGCIIPRTKHHFDALRAQPPRTPARLNRLAGYVQTDAADLSDDEAAAGIAAAHQQLKRSGYRARILTDKSGVSVSAERGYLRETGNLLFHISLVGILISVGVGGGFIYTGQKVVVVGQSFVNSAADYDSMSPGRWFNADALAPYSLKVTKFDAKYSTQKNSIGQAIDYTTYVTTSEAGAASKKQTIKVNSPLHLGDTDVYLLGNGYAPWITVRDPQGVAVFSQPVPFLPQDANLTSSGTVKIPDGLAKQVGMVGLFYPTECDPTLCGDAPTSVHPDLFNPVLTLNVYTGNLGLDNGQAQNAYVLNTDHLKKIAGFNSEGNVAGLSLSVGDTVDLPDGLGTVELTKVPRYVSLDIHHDPTQLWVLTFAILVFVGLITGLFIPRRRVWVRAARGDDGIRFEYAGLARGEDPTLPAAIAEIAKKHSQQLGLTMKP
jgi:cytochrome c biogenesis protein